MPTLPKSFSGLFKLFCYSVSEITNINFPMLSSSPPNSCNNRSNISSASESSACNKMLSRSSMTSKVTQNQDIYQQIAHYKEKAHQSFMQVLYPLSYSVKSNNFINNSFRACVKNSLKKKNNMNNN